MTHNRMCVDDWGAQISLVLLEKQAGSRNCCDKGVCVAHVCAASGIDLGPHVPRSGQPDPNKTTQSQHQPEQVQLDIIWTECFLPCDALGEDPCDI